MSLEITKEDKYMHVCICKQITRARIKEVIKAGATTLQMVKYKTGAGSGACQGRRCTSRIQSILDESQGQKFNFED